MKPKVPHVDIKKKAETYRRLLVTFLALFQLEGLTTFSLGIWLLTKIHTQECKFLSEFYSAPSLLLATGCIMVVVCTLGIVSTYKARNNHNLRPFAIFIMVCLALELAAPIHSTIDFKHLDDLDFYVSMSDSFDRALLSDSGELQCWKILQEKNYCCGLNSYKDWLSDESVNKTVPDAITKLGVESCQCGKRKQRRCVSLNSSGVSSVFGVPCYKSVYKDLDFQSLFLRILCPILLMTQVTTLAFISFIIIKLQGANTISTYIVDYQSSRSHGGDGTVPAFMTSSSSSTTTINSMANS